MYARAVACTRASFYSANGFLRVLSHGDVGVKLLLSFFRPAGCVSSRARAKLAAPDRLTVEVTGDGSFYFGGPCSVFATEQ